MAQSFQGPQVRSDGYSSLPVSDEHIEDSLANQNELDAETGDAELLPVRDGSPVVADSIPLAAWFVAAIEAGERFAFFGIHGPLQNYIQLPAEGGLRHGGLGLGQRSATVAKLLFTIWCYVTPIFAAIVADQYWGRYRTILYSTIPYILGLGILTGSALLVDDENSNIPTIGLAVAMIVIGIGTGGIKANVSPLIAEQYQLPRNLEIQLRGGQKAIIGYEATLQRIFLVLYMFLNIGAFGALATAAIEQRFGFVMAFGLTLVVFILTTIVLATTSRLYIKSSPAGSVLADSLQIIRIALFSRGNLDRAKPENFSVPPAWDTELVDEVRQALSACRVFAFLPLYWCAYSQIITNLISQAGTMRTGSIPNDLLVYSDALMVIIVTPIFDKVVYPYLNRRGIHFSPIRRIAAGFCVCALAMAYATLLQARIYTSAPCYDHPLSSTCEGGQVPNDIHVLWQLPVYLLVAVSEIFVAVTGIEFAYEAAPKSMKSLVTALFLCTNAGGMVLAIGFEQLAEDPLMIWFYGSLTFAVALGGILYCYVFRHSLRSGLLQKQVLLDE